MVILSDLAYFPNLTSGLFKGMLIVVTIINDNKMVEADRKRLEENKKL